MTHIIVIPDRITNPDIEHDHLKSAFGSNYKIVCLGLKNWDDASEEDKEWIGKANAILAWHDLVYGHNFWKHTSIELQCIVRVGVGVDNVSEFDALTWKTPISNVPDYGVNDVADHTLALALSLARELQCHDTRAKNGDWTWPEYTTLRRITDFNIGIVGFGRIGQAVCKRFQAFGCLCMFYDPYVARGVEKVWDTPRYDNFDTMVMNSDILTFHVPLTNETNRMFNSHHLPLIRNNRRDPIILINTSRGGVVDTDTLMAGMNFEICGLGLDVMEDEPPDDFINWVASTPSTELVDNIIITPHMAFLNKQSLEEMRIKAVQEAIRYLKEIEDPIYRVY